MLSHRACRQKPLISETFRIDYAYLDVAIQPVVLQAIVTHNDLGGRVARQQRLRRVGAVGVDKDRDV